MLTVQTCQQHWVVVMHPNNAKSLPVATVAAAAKLGHRRGKCGTRNEERIARRSHVSKKESRLKRGRGLVGVPHPTCRKNQGKNLTRMKHKAARAKRRMQELTFGTVNVRTAAFKCVNDISHIDVLLTICAAKDVIGVQETKRDGISEIVAAGYRVYFSGDCSGVKGRKWPVSYTHLTLPTIA